MSVHLEAVPSAAAIVVIVCCVRRGANDLQLGSDAATGRHELRVRECPVGLRSPARHRLFNFESDIIVFERGINRHASSGVPVAIHQYRTTKLQPPSGLTTALFCSLAVPL